MRLVAIPVRRVVPAADDVARDALAVGRGAVDIEDGVPLRRLRMRWEGDVRRLVNRVVHRRLRPRPGGVRRVERRRGALVEEAARGGVEGLAVSVRRVPEGPGAADAGNRDEERAGRLQPAQVELVDMLAIHRRPLSRIGLLVRRRELGIALAQRHGTIENRLAGRDVDDGERLRLREVERPELIAERAEIGELGACAGKVAGLVDLDGARDEARLVVDERNRATPLDQDFVAASLLKRLGQLQQAVVRVVDEVRSGNARAAQRDQRARDADGRLRRGVARIAVAGDAEGRRIVERQLANLPARLRQVFRVDLFREAVERPVGAPGLLARLEARHRLDQLAARQRVHARDDLGHVVDGDDQPPVVDREQLLHLPLVFRKLDRTDAFQCLRQAGVGDVRPDGQGLRRRGRCRQHHGREGYNHTV